SFGLASLSSRRARLVGTTSPEAGSRTSGGGAPSVRVARLASKSHVHVPAEPACTSDSPASVIVSTRQSVRPRNQTRRWVVCPNRSATLLNWRVTGSDKPPVDSAYPE